MENRPISISSIKSQYPDEWVLIGNPKEANGELYGIVILHEKDKKILVSKITQEHSSIEYSKTILRYTGNLPAIGKWLKFTR